MLATHSQQQSSATLPTLGFVMLSFNQPDQTLFLCRRLTELFEGCTIALHNDFGKCDLDRKQLPRSVHLVEPWFKTGWGVYPVVEANFAALRLLASTTDPDWIVFLSTTDYPIKSPRRILTELRDTAFDAFLDARQLHSDRPTAGHQRNVAQAFADPAWGEVAYNRYVATDVNPDRLTWRFPALHRPRLLRGSFAERWLTPFTPRFRPFGGDAWYTINRKAARILSEKNAQLQRLERHYRNRRSPEESIYQTILCNRPDLRIHPGNLRYTDWSQGGPSPRLLGAADLPVLLASPAHFARKFPFDTDLFRQIDEAVDQDQQG